MAKTGRPSKYSEELAADICERLCDGESLRAICLSDDMPSRATIFNWLSQPEHKRFLDQYARAKEEQADALADDILAIADQYDQAKEKLEGGTDHIQRAKLRIDTRKWIASKLKPKKYGDASLVKLADENGEQLKIVLAKDVDEL